MTTIPRNNFEREHTHFHLRNDMDSYCVAYRPTSRGFVREVTTVPQKVALSVHFPYGLKSCFSNSNAVAAQFNLHIGFRDAVNKLVKDELRDYMPPTKWREFERRYEQMLDSISDFGFRYATPSGASSYNPAHPRHKTSFTHLYMETNFPWITRSFERRDTNPADRAFWNRVEYKIELLAIEFKQRLKGIKKTIKSNTLFGDDMTTFDKNIHIISGYRSLNYEPLPNMFADSYLEILNLPPNNVAVDPKFFKTHKELKALNVALPFKEADKHFRESMGQDGHITEGSELGICWLTGHTGFCKKIRYYGQRVSVNKDILKRDNIPLTWLSCVESYVYSYDPRIEIGKLKITEDNKHKLGVELLDDSLGVYGIRSIQHGYFKSKGFQYCEGSEDWCDKPVTLYKDPKQTLYSYSFACSNFRMQTNPDSFEALWFDHSDPCVRLSNNYLSSDPIEKWGHNRGAQCGIPFGGNSPEKFYGYMRHNKVDELEITKYAKPGERYYGIEIELERKDRNTDAFIMLSEVIPKLKEIGFVSGTDMSLNNGVEFRSCPQTFTVLKENVKRFYEIVSPYFVAKETCGVHIHVSRSSLTNYQIGKLIGFVYNPSNANFIRDVSGRESGRWQEFSSGSTFTRLEDIFDPTQPRITLNKRKIRLSRESKIVENKKRKRLYEFDNGEEKYTAVNTLNRHTVEFRLFKGTHNVSECLSYLEFVDSVCKYTETGKVDLPLKKLMSYKEFKNWLTYNGQRYANLCKRLLVTNKNSADTSNFSFTEWVNRKKKKGKISCA
jgi:hypothetical protein